MHGEVRRSIGARLRVVSGPYGWCIVTPRISSIFNVNSIKIQDEARSRNNDKTGMTHIVSDLVQAWYEQISMVLEKVTVQIFCTTSSKFKTSVFWLSEIDCE